MEISQVTLTLESSLAADLNLYLTILTLGILDYLDVLDLPASMEVLSHPWVLITAGLLFVVEFFADKIPYVDNTWDAIHSFVRIPAGAVLAVAAMSDLPPHLVWVAALVGGFVSFSSHGAKASTRLAVNASPEPFSNWFLSVAEDVLSIGVLWLVSHYPYVAVAAVLILVVLALLVIMLLFRFFKRIFRREPARSST
jgi:hypothetical protein